MSTRRHELTRQAARLFAEKGYHGTSIGDLAEAMGVQKGSLYAHIESKQDLLYETCARAPPRSTARSTRFRRTCPRSSKIRLALRAHLRVVGRAARRGDGVDARVALPRGRAARGVRRGAPAVRGADPRPVPRGRRARRAAGRPGRRGRSAALPLGGELGVHLAAARGGTRTRSPTGSSPCSSTGCAATRRPPRLQPWARPPRS